MDERHHHQYDAMLRSDQQRRLPELRDEDPDFHPPQPWTQTDALLSEVLRVLHGLRADIEAMNETLRKMREERRARVVAFPATSLRNGTPR